MSRPVLPGANVTAEDMDAQEAMGEGEGGRTVTAIQYALPFLGEATEQHDMAERYPVTAEELRTVPDGVRLARFVDDRECEKCEWAPFDHWSKYRIKVCLKDLARLGLWRPEDEKWYRLQRKREQIPAGKAIEFYPKPKTTRTYRILHYPTHTWAELNADSVEEAVRIASSNHPDTWPELTIDSTDEEVRQACRNHPDTGAPAQWRIEDCTVRQFTGKGWGKPRREHA